MLRKTMIVLLTAAALTGVLTADAFARGGGGGGHGAGSAVAVIWAAGSAVAVIWAAGLAAAVIWAAGSAAAALAWAAALAEAISPVVAWVSVAALRLMPRCAATSAAITFIAADASGSVAAMTTGVTSTPITHRTAICMGTDVPRRRGGRVTERTGHKAFSSPVAYVGLG
jgi:hypothetical protein